MCNCISEAPEKIEKYLKDKGVNLTSNVELSGTAIQMDNETMAMNQVTVSELSYEETVTNKKGISKTKKSKIKIAHTYCPFCGEKYETS